MPIHSLWGYDSEIVPLTSRYASSSNNLHNLRGHQRDPAARHGARHLGDPQPVLVGSVVADIDLTGHHRVRIVLHLKYMRTIGVRELQQHASAALRRVERGETIGVTDRGRLVAVLSPPSAATGAAALVASSRVLGARRRPRDLPEPVRVVRSTAAVLDELRAEG